MKAFGIGGVVHPGTASAPPQYAHAVAETSYASCGDLSLAYQVFGDGPIELVVAGSFASHIELAWTYPEFEAFMEQLAMFCRILLFDKAGVGLSDPIPKVRLLEERAAEIEAVMDAVGFGRAAVFGLSEGGPASIVFAATRPERTRALILYGSLAFGGSLGWEDLERDPDELTASSYTGSGEQLLNGVLDSAFRNRHTCGDFLIGQAFQDEAQHLALPIVECRRGRGLALRLLIVDGREGGVQPEARGHDGAVGVRIAECGEFVGGTTEIERTSGVEIGHEDALVRAQDLRRLAHEAHARDDQRLRFVIAAEARHFQ